MKTEPLSIRIGVHSIGGRKSVRSLDSLRTLSYCVISLANADRYRQAAKDAVQTGAMVVLIPAGLTEESIDQFFDDLVTMQSYGNADGEPTYPSLTEANNGRNQDGSVHRGYLVVDVIERLVIDLIGRDGKTLLHTPLVKYATADKVVV